MRIGLVLLVPLVAACNGIAGIADLHTGDLEGGRGGGGTSHGGNDAGTDAAGNVSTDAGADTASPPTCSGQGVGLRISVLSSTSGLFTGVTDGSTITVLVGSSHDYCFPAGMQIQLQAIPDESSATHDWGSICTPGRRCQFTLQQPTVIDVRLQ